MVGDDHGGHITLALGTDPHHRISGRVPHCITDQIDQNLQRAAKFAGRRQRFVQWRRVDPHPRRACAQTEQSGGTARHVGQIDRLRRHGEIRPLDRLQIDQIVDQTHQVPTGIRDVGGIISIVLAQRTLGLRVDAVRIGDNPTERGAQRGIQLHRKRTRQTLGLGIRRLERVRFRGHHMHRADEAGEYAHPVGARRRCQSHCSSGRAQSRALIVEALPHCEPTQNWECAVFILTQCEQSGQRPAKHLGSIEAVSCTRRRRQESETQRCVRFPQPVGTTTQEIAVPLMIGRTWPPRRAHSPTGNVQPHALRRRAGLYPKIDVAIAIPRHHGARYEDSEPLRQSRQRGDLRDGNALPDRATGTRI